MKHLIFDAGPIISLTMNGMLSVLVSLRKNFDGEFIITPQVKREVIDRPMKILKYKFEAIQVKDLLDRGILKLSTSIVPQDKLDHETKRVLKVCNGVLRTTKDGEKIRIIHEGEASCLALSNLCNCDNMIVVDERTTRVLIEAPKALERLMENKLHMPLDMNEKLLHEIHNQKFIRSTELVFVAYKKDLFPLKKSKETLDALLYGLKFKGTAISSQEIEEMKRIA